MNLDLTDEESAGIAVGFFRGGAGARGNQVRQHGVPTGARRSCTFSTGENNPAVAELLPMRYLATQIAR